MQKQLPATHCLGDRDTRQEVRGVWIQKDLWPLRRRMLSVLAKTDLTTPSSKTRLAYSVFTPVSSLNLSVPNHPLYRFSSFLNGGATANE